MWKKSEDIVSDLISRGYILSENYDYWSNETVLLRQKILEKLSILEAHEDIKLLINNSGLDFLKIIHYFIDNYEDLPLYINDENIQIKRFVKWYLSVGR